ATHWQATLAQAWGQRCGRSANSRQMLMPPSPLGRSTASKMPATLLVVPLQIGDGAATVVLKFRYAHRLRPTSLNHQQTTAVKKDQAPDHGLTVELNVGPPAVLGVARVA